MAKFVLQLDEKEEKIDIEEFFGFINNESPNKAINVINDFHYVCKSLFDFLQMIDINKLKTNNENLVISDEEKLPDFSITCSQECFDNILKNFKVRGYNIVMDDDKNGIRLEKTS